jgi:hypothetical protein
VIILFAALALRLWALDRGLPWSFHPDENNYVDVARDMLDAGDPNPRYFKNPSAFIYLIAGQVWLERQLAASLGLPSLASRSAEYLTGRLDSALLGVATVGLIYLLGRRLFDRTVGLVAAALLAVTFLHVRDSHYAVNDVPAAALLVLSVYLAARFLERPGLGWLLLAGAAGGLATTTKYSVGFFFVPILVAVGAVGLRAVGLRAIPLRGGSGCDPDDGSGVVPLPRLAIWLTLAGLVAVLVFFLGTPYTLLDYPTFVDFFHRQYAIGDRRGLGRPIIPIPLYHFMSLCQGFGAIPLVLACVGLVVGLRRAPRAPTLLVAAFPAIYLAYMLTKLFFVPRVHVPVLPFLALLAGLGVVALARRAPEERRPLALGLLLLAAGGQSLLFSALHAQILSQTDTRRLAHQWMQANLPPGSAVRVEWHAVLDRDDDYTDYIPNPAGLHYRYFLGRPSDDQVDQFVAAGVGYYLSSSLDHERYYVDPDTTRAQAQSRASFYDELARRGRLLATFAPTYDGREAPYTDEDTRSPYWNLFRYARPGPTLRLYALPSQVRERRAR